MKTNKTNYQKKLFLACLASWISMNMIGQTIFKEFSGQIPQNNTLGTDTFDSDLLDIDGDRDLDMFIAEGTSGFTGRPNRLLLNDGKGSFTDVSKSNLPSSPLHANSISADFADFDNDGDLDIVVANLGPKQLLRNDGNGIFTDVSSDLLPPPPVNILEDISTEIGFEDVNNDGRMDIFITNEIPPIPDIGPGGSQNFLFIQNSEGIYEDQSLTRLPNEKIQSGSFAFGDIDNDGDRDLIVANIGQNQVLINNGDGFFTKETTSRITQQTTSSRAAVLVDIDHDKDLDLIVANSNLEQNQVFINDGSGFFQENTENALPLKLDISGDMKVFDFNYDGHPDIIFANADPNPMGPVNGGHPLAPAPNSIYINDGTGVFSDKSADFLPENNEISFDIEIADVNGDRLDDILVSNANTGIEQLYIRNLTPPTRFNRIIPFTNCVVENNNGTYTATFGYYNYNKIAIYIPGGQRNKLVPYHVDAKSEQPVIFLPGVVKEAFTATFYRKTLWKVNRRHAFASRRTHRCNPEYNNYKNEEKPMFDISNHPNPFSTTTTIKYTLPEPNTITFAIYDGFGKEIKTMKKYVNKGTHELEINTNILQLKPGMYFYSITAGIDKVIKSFMVK